MDGIIDRDVYILGAGFSAGAGAPLIHNFLDVSKQLHDRPYSGLEPFEREHFKRVFEFRREMAQARDKIRIDLDDIEQLFGLVEVSHRFRGTPLETRNSMVYLIAKTLQMSINGKKQREQFTVSYSPEFLIELIEDQAPFVVEAQNRWFHVDVYDFFAAMVSGLFDDLEKRKSRRDTIITFNYDLICEHALRRFGVVADYHLNDQSVDDRREPGDHGKVSVLKLHGSTNWGICDVCNKRVVILSNKLTDSPSEFKSLACADCRQQRFVPLLVPPSWDKSGYADLVAPIWRHAISELESATRICIIGYSIPETDAFFKYLITTALAGNHQLDKLIVVDYRKPVFNHPRSLDVQAYEEDLVKPRYVKLLDELFRERRFVYYDRGFSNFLRDPGFRSQLSRCEMLQDTNFG
jgi:hypothetical protein